ncbi:unnamed protein product, partial [Prorocentrum cordatum]
VGCYVGYSAVRLGATVRRWGGRVVLTGRWLNDRAARSMVAWAGLSDTVDVWVGHSEQLAERLSDSLPGVGSRVGMAFFDQRGSRFHEDLARLERLQLLEPGALVVDNVLKPGAPVFLWELLCCPGPFETRVVALQDFGSAGVADWISVSRFTPGPAEPSDWRLPQPRRVRDLARVADAARWRSVDGHVSPRGWNELSRQLELDLAAAGVRPAIVDVAGLRAWLSSPRRQEPTGARRARRARRQELGEQGTGLVRALACRPGPRGLAGALACRPPRGVPWPAHAAVRLRLAACLAKLLAWRPGHALPKDWPPRRALQLVLAGLCAALGPRHWQALWVAAARLGGGGAWKGGKGKGKGKDKAPIDEGLPDEIEEVGEAMRPCEDELVCKCTNNMVPHFNARNFFENKEQIGKVDEIF